MTTNGSTQESHCMFVVQGTVYEDLPPKEPVNTMKENTTWMEKRTLSVILQEMVKCVGKILNERNCLNSISKDMSEKSW